MKKELNIAYVDFGNPIGHEGSSGIERKKLAQIEELSKLGTVTRHQYSNNEQQNSIWIKLTLRLPFFPSNVFFGYDQTYANLDVLYYRRTYLDLYTIRFFKDVRFYNPKCTILFEIPTYPYDMEMKGIKTYPILLKEKWNRRKLHKYVDRIILVTSKEKKVFKVPTIQTLNGIDFTKTHLRNISCEEKDSIHAIIIADFAFWHGVDRLIDGLIKYYKVETETKTPFFLHLVGAGDGIVAIREKCRIGGIQEYVILYGSLPYIEINKVYDKVSIAINSIGRHRVSGTKIDSSIKSREYGAKGLPVVTEKGIPIDYLPPNYPYVFEVPADDSPINIENIIDFHNLVYQKNSREVADTIRAIAQKNCSTEAMMKPVLEYITSGIH